VSIRLLSYMRYLSGGATYTQPFYDTHKLVTALKGEPVKGFVNIKLGGRTVELRDPNKDLAADWFGERVAELRLTPELPYYLCCLPDSGCTLNGVRTSKIERLALAVQARVPRMKIVDVFRFKTPMPKSHETNMRDPATLFSSLEVVSLPPLDGRVIILDDVCTSGAHIAAATAHLKAHNVSDVVAICAARTNYNNQDVAIKWQAEELNEFTPEDL
jgi:hypothetical protein